MVNAQERHMFVLIVIMAAIVRKLMEIMVNMHHTMVNVQHVLTKQQYKLYRHIIHILKKHKVLMAHYACVKKD